MPQLNNDHMLALIPGMAALRQQGTEATWHVHQRECLGIYLVIIVLPQELGSCHVVLHRVAKLQTKGQKGKHATN